MATDNRRGFRPARHLRGGQIRTVRMAITASGNQVGVFPGQPVISNPNGYGITGVSGGVAATQALLGVAVALYDSNNKPLTFSQPTRGPFLPGGTAGFADVIIDPDVTFIVQGDASANANMIGQFVSLTAASLGNTAAGVSNFEVAVGTVDTSIKPVQIIGIAQTEDAGLGSNLLHGGFGASQDLEVILAIHELRGSRT